MCDEFEQWEESVSLRAVHDVMKVRSQVKALQSSYMLNDVANVLETASNRLQGIIIARLEAHFSNVDLTPLLIAEKVAQLLD